MAVYAFILYLHRKNKINLFLGYCSILFLALFLLVLIYFRFIKNLGLFAIILLSFFSLFFIITSFPVFKAIIREPKKNLVLILPYLLTLFFILGSCPVDFISGGVTINFFVHCLSFVLGISIFLFDTVLDKKL
jgi:hypothetical protein